MEPLKPWTVLVMSGAIIISAASNEWGGDGGRTLNFSHEGGMIRLRNHSKPDNKKAKSWACKKLKRIDQSHMDCKR